MLSYAAAFARVASRHESSRSDHSGSTPIESADPGPAKLTSRSPELGQQRFTEPAPLPTLGPAAALTPGAIVLYQPPSTPSEADTNNPWRRGMPWPHEFKAFVQRLLYASVLISLGTAIGAALYAGDRSSQTGRQTTPVQLEVATTAAGAASAADTANATNANSSSITTTPDPTQQLQRSLALIPESSNVSPNALSHNAAPASNAPTSQQSARTVLVERFYVGDVPQTQMQPVRSRHPNQTARTFKPQANAPRSPVVVERRIYVKYPDLPKQSEHAPTQHDHSIPLPTPALPSGAIANSHSGSGVIGHSAGGAYLPPPPTLDRNQDLPISTNPASNSPAIAAVPANTESTIQLIGVMDAGPQSVALFQHNDVTRSVRLGGLINSQGWSLINVNQDQATIERYGVLHHLVVGDRL